MQKYVNCEIELITKQLFFIIINALKNIFLYTDFSIPATKSSLKKIIILYSA